ncbi:hypothetical protein LPICM02_30013 [Pseudolactococcus piscium]|nr:hypothetical protein LPICM02_30013 [Lactococcus piscium]
MSVPYSFDLMKSTEAKRADFISSYDFHHFLLGLHQSDSELIEKRHFVDTNIFEMRQRTLTNCKDIAFTMEKENSYS